jgi:hypothetical protein
MRCPDYSTIGCRRKLVISALLKTSAVSGKRAEPDLLGKCEFTEVEVLKTELATSEASGKFYRIDQQSRSAVSGKVGHKQEFVACWETRLPLLPSEGERSEATGRFVRPGILELCAVTQKRVLPSELERSAASGKRAPKKFFVTSGCSGARLLESEAVVSIAGAFCGPSEARQCKWSGKRSHPDDLTICHLTGLTIHRQFATVGTQPRLQPFAELLDGFQRTADRTDLWSALEKRISGTLHGKRCQVEAARISPDRHMLAVSIEIPVLLGLGTHYAGCVYSIADDAHVGRIPRGKRNANGWVALA